VPVESLPPPAWLPLFFLDDFLAQFSFGGEGAAINNAKRFFLFVVGQGTFLAIWVACKFITGCRFRSPERTPR